MRSLAIPEKRLRLRVQRNYVNIEERDGTTINIASL